MIQCPDCESKDRITIAGKVFCANCGTPWVPSEASKQADAAQAAAAPPSSANAVVLPEPVSPAVVAPGKPAKPSPPTSPLETAKPAQPPSSQPMIKVRSIDEKKTVSSQIQQTDSISKFAAKPLVQASKPEPVQNPNPIAQPDEASVKPVQPITPSVSQPIVEPTDTKPAPSDQTSPVIPSVGQTITPVAPPVTESDIEIPDLHDHAQAVLTDKQFSDLADLNTNVPAPSSDSEPTLSPATVASVLRTPVAPEQTPAVNPPTPPAETKPIEQAVPIAAPLAQATAAGSPATAIPVAVTPTPMEPTPAVAPQASPPVTRLQDMLAPTAPVPPQPVPTPTPSAAPAPDQSDMSHDKLVITPATKPPTMRVPNGGIDGVSSMSRDQALKLALGESGDSEQSGSNGTYKPLKVAVAVVVVLLVGGYIWQINYPNLAIKIASTRAGLSASAPHYLPSGWSVDRKIVSNQNKLEFTIRSSNGNQLKVTQLKTDWDSAALLESYVSSEANNIETVQAQGLTIYLYGDNQASWINHGNWFRLDGSGSGLSQEEMIKIATSL